MKKNYFVLFCLLFFGNNLFAQSSLCPSEGQDQTYEWVTRIKIADGERTSGKTGYMDFTSSAIATLTAGETYPVEIDVHTNGNYNEFVKLWLDKNQDNQIQDPGEKVYDQNSNVEGFHTFTGNITIPSTAFNGSMVVRMIMQYSAAPKLCDGYTYGTTYDVKVNIVGGNTNPANYNLTVSTTGKGEVVSDPEGIATAQGTTSFDFPAGTNVTLTAAPETDADFDNWSGDASGTNSSYSFTVNEDSNVIANFTSATPAPVINTDPSNSVICFKENTTFSIEATGATSYQWQVNTESGFVNITDGDVYSGVTTNKLGITGATDAIHGKQYRCVATNNTGSVNSKSATLSVTHITAAITSQTKVSCNGESDGAATVIGSGGTGNYTYFWSNGATTASITDVPAGTYTVEVFGENGCKGTASVSIGTTPDNTAPVPNNITLEDIIVQCEVTTGRITAPTATDNCAGVVTATTSDPLTYTDPGSHTIKWIYDDGNGNTATQTQDVTIEASPLDAVTFDDASFVYNGTVHNIEVDNLPASATVTYSISPESGTENGATNAGEYIVTATLSSGNVDCPDIELKANLTIEKAQATITAEAVQTFTYDGAVKNVTASPNHEETALSYSPQQGYTAAGTYPINITAEETANYKAASEEVSLVIEKAELEGVNFEGATSTYNGTAHGLAVSGLPEGATVKYVNNDQINAETYNVTATVSQENYKELELSAILIIEKAEAIITAEAVQTFTYDGAVKNVTASLNHEETVLSFSPQQGYTAAGTYTISITAEATANYKAASEEVNLVIDKAELEGLTFPGNSFTYDGKVHSLAVSGLPEGATVKYDNNDKINAGTYNVTATVSQENYNDLVLTANLIIEKAEAIITAEAVKAFTYDGAVKNVTASLNHEETALSYSPQQGYIAAGTYSISITAEGTANYKAASEEVSLVIEKAEIEGVTFPGDTFTYNGTAHSLAVSVIPEGASVEYDNNDQINAGTYNVTATVSQANYNDQVLTADLIINRAEQHISFEELEAIPLRNAADFQLNAAASSGLPVSYSYTYEAENPAATVTAGGLVTPMEAGKITITATQGGNHNYKEAVSVSRGLSILGSHARLQNAVINGSSYGNPSEEIYYLINCGNNEDEVKIQLNPIIGAEVDEEDIFVIPTPAPGIYRRNVKVTSEDGSDVRTYRIKIERTFNFEDVVVQKFNNVLLVNNNPETNGGYKFVKYEWYKNDNYVGSGQYFSEGPNANDRLDANSTFHVVMTTEEGEVLQTCPTTIEMKSSNEVVLTPNPVAAGGRMELLTAFPKEELETMEIFIHSLNGDLIKQIKSNKKLTSIPLSGSIAKGVYILSCKTGTRTKTLKFIVK